MAIEYQTVPQMYERLQLMIRHRRDTGFRRAVADATLQPRNPFAPITKRRPKIGLTVAIALLLTLAAIFVFFSFRGWS
jgi:hypothetical protein